MTILFICSALEPGKDGIGDYTRNLAQECLANGVTPFMVAVNDEYIDQSTLTDTDGIVVYRLPKRMGWKQKGDEVLKILNTNNIDWISLQFQPYGFSEKGIIGDASAFLTRFSAWKIHVMMHELWIAEEKQAPFKMKLVGFLQKRSILSLLKKLKPRVVQTSIPLYNKILMKAGIKSSVLPLFSNVQYQESEHLSYYDKIPALLCQQDERITACLFGSIYHDSWDMDSLFNALKREGKKSGKGVVIVSLGKISFGKDFWNGLPAKYPDINFLTLGPQDEGFISFFLNHYVDVGIVTTPAVIAGKSGSCMAYLEHGIPVVCKQNDLTFGFGLEDNIIDKRIIQIADGDDLKLPERAAPSRQLKDTTLQLIQTLNSITQ